MRQARLGSTHRLVRYTTHGVGLWRSRPGCGVWKLICISGPLRSSAQIRAGASAALQEPRSTAGTQSCHSSWTQDVPMSSRGTLQPGFHFGPLTLPRPLKEAQQQLLQGACACTFQMPWLRICLPNPLLHPPSPAMFFFHSFTKYTDSVSSVSAGVDQSST